MALKKTWKTICLTGLTVLLGTTLVACQQEEKKDTEIETKAVEEKTQEIFFEERPVQIDYNKAPEEILANYTEQGMNVFKVNFPDTLSMNYALKHIGQTAPEITGKTMDGQTVKLSDLKGKKVLINFAKTTCSICKEMSPVVKQIGEENKDLVVLTVFPVDNKTDIETYYKDLKLGTPANTLSLQDNPHIKDVAVKGYHIEQVPTFVFVDESGKISYTYIGNKDKVMFQDMIGTAFGEEKLYDHARTVTIRVDKDGKEIVEEKLIDEKKINEDSVDHTETDVEKVKAEEKAKQEAAKKTAAETKAPAEEKK